MPDRATIEGPRPPATPSGGKEISPNLAKQRIGGLSFTVFKSLTRRHRRKFLDAHYGVAARMLEAGTLPTRWEGQVLRMRLDAWRRAIGDAAP